ncbi:hypothetical protein K440DRAFT_644696 [Wilcoxina mikolae CBS 423.85]|nr:hypothetical protein K440DRAFT_644696 [Wilcoxina mikolae CBS 423.85]
MRTILLTLPLLITLSTSQPSLSPAQSSIVHDFHSLINTFATNTAWAEFNAAAQTEAKRFYATYTADGSLPTQEAEMEKLYDGLEHDVEFVATQTVLTGKPRETLWVVAKEFLRRLEEAGKEEGEGGYETDGEEEGRKGYETDEGKEEEERRPYKTTVETVTAKPTAEESEAPATTTKILETTHTAEKTTTMATSIVKSSSEVAIASATVAPIATAEPGAASTVKDVSRVLVGMVVGGAMVVVAVM